jgi:hypothetical protein
MVELLCPALKIDFHPFASAAAFGGGMKVS